MHNWLDDRNRIIFMYSCMNSLLLLKNDWQQIWSNWMAEILIMIEDWKILFNNIYYPCLVVWYHTAHEEGKQCQRKLDAIIIVLDSVLNNKVAAVELNLSRISDKFLLNCMRYNLQDIRQIIIIVLNSWFIFLRYLQWLTRSLHYVITTTMLHVVALETANYINLNIWHHRVELIAA